MDVSAHPVLLHYLDSTILRLLLLAAPFAVLLGMEALWPLFTFRRADVVGNSIRNFVLTAIFLALNLLLNPISPFVLQSVNDAHFGIIYWAGFSPTAGFVVGILGLDLFAYFAHVSMHKIHTLWRFHRVHHADRRVNVTTAFREHPGETLWRISWHLAAVVMFGTSPWVLLTYLTISAFNAQLEHCNLKVPRSLDRWLRLAYVTPNMHKLHHHRYLPETDMNYSNLFSVWDRLFRTYHRGPNFGELRYGLDDFDWDSKNSVKELLLAPFTVPYSPPMARVVSEAGASHNRDEQCSC